MSDLEASYGFEEENQGAGMKKLKTKLRLTWEDAAIAGQIENEKVNKKVISFFLYDSIYSDLVTLYKL